MSNSNQDGPEYIIGMPTAGYYKIDDRNIISETCNTECPLNLDVLVNNLGSQAVAHLCMQDAARGESGNEYIVHIRMNCDSPQRKILSGTKCGLKLDEPEVIKSPFKFDTGN